MAQRDAWQGSRSCQKDRVEPNLRADRESFRAVGEMADLAKARQFASIQFAPSNAGNEDDVVGPVRRQAFSSTRSTTPQRRQNSIVRVLRRLALGWRTVPSRCSTTVAGTPFSPNSMARARPAGPAPTIRIGVSPMGVPGDRPPSRRDDTTIPFPPTTRPSAEFLYIEALYGRRLRAGRQGLLCLGL